MEAETTHSEIPLRLTDSELSLETDMACRIVRSFQQLNSFGQYISSACPTHPYFRCSKHLLINIPGIRSFSYLSEIMQPRI